MRDSPVSDCFSFYKEETVYDRFVFSEEIPIGFHYKESLGRPNV